MIKPAPPSIPADAFRRPWEALYNSASGRLDAVAIAAALGVDLHAFIAALGQDPADAYIAADAPSLQQPLAPVARVLEMLFDSFQSPALVRAWLQRPRADMEGDTPIRVILANETGALVSLLEGAQLGIVG